MNTKENLAKGEKKFETSSDSLHAKKKKTILLFLVLAAVLFAILIIVAKFSQQKSNVSSSVTVGSYGAGVSAGSAGVAYPTPALPVDNSDQFYVPGDAAENGELSLAVSDLSQAQKNVSVIAEKNGGSVYSTHITYGSNSPKKGVIVVQVPAQQFEKTFDALKLLATKIFQESTQKIELRNNIVYPMSASQGSSAEVPKATPDSANVDNVDSKSVANSETTSTSAVAPSIAIAPVYYPQTVQDKGYIKVTFVDDNRSVSAVQRDISSKVWIAFFIKILFVMLLLVLLILLVAKSFKISRHARAERKNKIASPTVTRQLSKSRKAVVKIKKK
ncbi:MAG: DUF4349 domain-containing protein [Candidatus Moraniibacteriota bacterium]